MNKDETTRLIEDNGLTLHGDIEHFTALVEEYLYAKYLEQPEPKQSGTFSITAIKAALEKQDKPMHPQLKAMLEDYFDKCFAESASKRTWVGLTDQVKQEWIDAMPNPPQPRHFMVLVNAIESELKEKNT
jgi:hypothetical protein